MPVPSHPLAMLFFTRIAGFGECDFQRANAQFCQKGVGVTAECFLYLFTVNELVFNAEYSSFVLV